LLEKKILLTAPQVTQERVMKQLPRTTAPSKQQTLTFPPVNGQVDLWNSLNESQQQKCRQVLREMLVAIVRQSRNGLRDYQSTLAQDLEELTDD
jgi:hypothetical protein